MEIYTTADKQKEDPIKEKKKVIISNDFYALTEAINNLTRVISRGIK